MKLKGQIKEVNLDFITHKPKIVIELTNQESILTDEFNQLQKEQLLEIEIDKPKKKRSLNSNAYAWKLITEIGNVLRKSKEEIYLEMLKDYGQSEIVSIISSINPDGYFKYYEEVGTGIVNNKEFTHYKIFKGSSEFDTREMSIFIDGIVQEAKELNIETLTPNEIEQLKSSWEVSNSK